STRLLCSSRSPDTRGAKLNDALKTPIDRGLTAVAAYTPFGGGARLRSLVKGLVSSDGPTLIWALVLWAVSVAAVGLLWHQGYDLPPIWAGLVLAAVAALADRQHIAVTERATQSASSLPLVFAAVVFGPLGGFAVGAFSTALDLREDPLRWSVYTPIRGLTAAAAGLAAWEIVPTP